MRIIKYFVLRQDELWRKILRVAAGKFIGNAARFAFKHIGGVLPVDVPENAVCYAVFCKEFRKHGNFISFVQRWVMHGYNEFCIACFSGSGKRKLQSHAFALVNMLIVFGKIIGRRQQPAARTADCHIAAGKKVILQKHKIIILRPGRAAMRFKSCMAASSDIAHEVSPQMMTVSSGVIIFSQFWRIFSKWLAHAGLKTSIGLAGGSPER